MPGQTIKTPNKGSRLQSDVHEMFTLLVSPIHFHGLGFDGVALVKSIEHYVIELQEEEVVRKRAASKRQTLVTRRGV